MFFYAIYLNFLTYTIDFDNMQKDSQQSSLYQKLIEKRVTKLILPSLPHYYRSITVHSTVHQNNNPSARHLCDSD